MSDENKIRDAADAIKGIVEAVPVYQDVAQPAAKEIGTALQTVAKSIHVALAPVSALVWGYEKIRDYLNETLADKLKDVPSDRIVTPNPAVAGPLIESLRFAAQEPSLREMYANLLAKAMDKNTMALAHPSFVEIIRQLSPDEARIIDYMSGFSGHRLASISGEIQASVTYEKGFFTSGKGFNHFSLLSERARCVQPDLFSSYLDNLCRLGLIQIIPYELGKFSFELPLNFSVLERHPSFLRHQIAEWENKLKKEHKINKKLKWRIERDLKREVIQLTSLGFQFCTACVERQISSWEAIDHNSRVFEIRDQISASLRRSKRVMREMRKSEKASKKRKRD